MINCSLHRYLKMSLLLVNHHSKALTLERWTVLDPPFGAYCVIKFSHTISSDAAGQYMWVLTAHDLHCGGSLKEVHSAQEVTGTPTRVGPIWRPDAGAIRSFREMT
ncbi:hypothetical protein EVAR_16436_1 [Eumeta japonica]|uniref:Uncharacterized protein n=1 Tax=Eumeta variegata TaxID=151549 RepID=A0A4C1ULK6_EUMVA|nr:hypothetical protein EVAR_16436_1 [Eumeta japonica]